MSVAPLLPLMLAFSAPTQAAPVLTLYTMGPGDSLFSQWGHAELCVGNKPDHKGKCYSYGYADFSKPLVLLVTFLRGEGRFWGARESETKMLKLYQETDQTLWRQTLQLPEDQSAKLVSLLAASMEPDAKYYRYHHFLDNCSTRIRDPLDQATGGALSRDNQTPDGPSFRYFSEDGLSRFLVLQAGDSLGLGREDDAPTSPWQRMAFPAELREQVRLRLGAEPELVYQRKGTPAPHTPHRGRYALSAFGVVLAGVALALGRVRPALARGLVVGILVTPALLLWGVAAVTQLGELRWNEALLCQWPTDLLLLGLGPEKRRRYLQIRLVGLGIVALLWALGVFIQPLAPALIFVGLPLGALLWLDRRSQTAVR